MRIYIDGNSGTTGLRIHERLSAREDITLLTLPEEKRKDPAAKQEIYAASDVVFFCLPDAAAREAASLAFEVQKTHPLRIIDTSTAHRTEVSWAYGFPELSDSMRRNIEQSSRTAVPGCHASGFIALVKPLIDANLVAKDALLTCHSLTGYSGGGKAMIASYEANDRPQDYDSPRQYALSQQHKHLREMVAVTGVQNAPAFCPIVGDFYSGMLVTVPLFRQQCKGSIEDIRAVYRETYTTELVQYQESIADEGGFIAASALCGKDSMRISVSGNEERILLTALYDNLGKGASGAAVQCLNIMTGMDETTGLVL